MFAHCLQHRPTMTAVMLLNTDLTFTSIDLAVDSTNMTTGRIRCIYNKHIVSVFVYDAKFASGTGLEIATLPNDILLSIGIYYTEFPLILLSENTPGGMIKIHNDGRIIYYGSDTSHYQIGCCTFLTGN